MRRVWFALALFAIAFTAPASALDQVITVSGDAALSVSPDIVIIHAGVTTQAKTALEASDANRTQMTAVLAALKGQGVADRDMQTTRFAIQPVYEPNNRGANSTIIGFQAINQITVRVRDITKLSLTVDRMIAAGANNMSGIEFMIADPSKALDRVRADAFEDARRKATIYATAAGRKLGQAVTINETGQPGPLAGGMLARQAVSVPLAPGEDVLRAAVMVTFELLP
jgi:uncharacterized protein YggE